MGWLSPIGTPGGICSGFSEIPDGSGMVRLGDRIMYLDSILYRIWQAAATAPQIEELAGWATAQGINDADRRISSLDDAELIVEQRGGIEQKIGRLAMRLIGECVGNGTDRRAEFGVIGRNGTRLNVDLYLFEMLMRTDGVHAVSVICDELDKARPDLARRSCLSSLTEGIPTLVRNGVVRLDVATR